MRRPMPSGGMGGSDAALGPWGRDESVARPTSRFKCQRRVMLGVPVVAVLVVGAQFVGTECVARVVPDRVDVVRVVLSVVVLDQDRGPVQPVVVPARRI